MIKDNFIITPESGSNNGKISVTANSHTDTNNIQSSISVQGEGIKKSINLIQKGYIDRYTPWAKQIGSKFDGKGNFLFPDIFHDAGSSSQPLRFPVDKIWLFDGTTAKVNVITDGLLMDTTNFRQIDRTTASGKTFSYRLNDKVINNANGCWVYAVKCSYSAGVRDSVELHTGDGSTCILFINHISLSLANGNPNLNELIAYLQPLGWNIEIPYNNQNNRIKIIAIEQNGRVPLFIKMIRQINTQYASDCFNLAVQ